MDHVAILRKSCLKRGDNLLGDILSGKKTIESRWYVNKTAPWDKIQKGETVYLKETGARITARAKVSQVIQYENLNSKTSEKIINRYGSHIAPSTSKKDFLDWVKNQKNKRHCILIFLKEVTPIEPFAIDKTGYGISAAWLVTEDISKLRK